MLTCKFCTKSFKHASSLNRHIRTHKDNKVRLSCCYCNKTYGRMDNFRRHFKIHQKDFVAPRHFIPRKEAVKPDKYVRPIEARTTGPIFRIVPGKQYQRPSRRIPITQNPLKYKPVFYEEFIGQALPKPFPVHPEWHTELLKTIPPALKDLYISDDEDDGPPPGGH